MGLKTKALVEHVFKKLDPQISRQLAVTEELRLPSPDRFQVCFLENIRVSGQGHRVLLRIKAVRKSYILGNHIFVL